MTKVFLQPLFGEPYAWTQKYLDNIAKVKGFEWKIFTQHDLKGGENTKIVKMTLADFDDLVLKYCGVDPNNHIEGKAPVKNLTDFYPAYGDIFQDYIKGYDFWGHTNWDCVYGRLGHFITDKMLSKSKIWADETNTVNGTFSLYRNTKEVNTLYQNVNNWQKVFTDYKLYGFDELEFSEYAVAKGFVTNPKHYPTFSYDRFPQHIPYPQLDYRDGRLYELFKDTVTERILGKELAWFHFSYSKKWPL